LNRTKFKWAATQKSEYQNMDRIPIKEKPAFQGVNVLRWHFGAIGQPKSELPPAWEPFEGAFGVALGTSDPATFECLCPALLFNRWNPQELIASTPEANRPRLRLASGIGLFFMNFSRLGVPWALETTRDLKQLTQQLADCSMANDPWSNPPESDDDEGLYLEFFKPYGLYVNWPLADFWKQFQWAMIQNHERVTQLQMETL
jgi:hypothetical protein